MPRRLVHDSDHESAESFSTIQTSDVQDLGDSILGTEGEYNDDDFENVNPSEEQELVPGHDTILMGAPMTDAQRYEQKANLFGFFNNNQKYVKAIKEMCTNNKESLPIDYSDLEKFHNFMDASPEMFLDVLDESLLQVTLLYFPNYSLIKQRVHGRIVGLPVTENLRDLRNSHLDKLVRVHGIVTRRSGIFSQYSVVKFTCTKCRATFGPFVGKDLKPTVCFECQNKGPFVVNSNETAYKDFQKITLQEVPGSVPSGTIPRSKDVLLYYDLIDSCKPGDEVDVTGIYKNSYSISLNLKNGFPVFSTLIEASSVTKNNLGNEQQDEDAKAVKQLSKNPNIQDLLINSVAPSIFGHRSTKLTVLLAMVGGEAKEKNGMRVRGDINVLLLGDPGTAKSQFLRYIHKISPRAVLATGQGSSGVGLTASVRRDPVLKEWTLEGGALVLADRGICCIDEFDKMNETDRVSIHEAMEQQSISISKAGIVASLHARCAVVAAANPTRGCYNPSLSFAQNINLTDPIISRFDLLCVIRDVVDEVEDTEMARFILSSHSSQSGSNIENDRIPDEMLRKYISYARNIHPVISQIDIQKISQLYSELRKESISSGIPITVRHIESIIRISEGFAKLRLSETVTERDIDSAISLTLTSFLTAQKTSMAKQLRRKFSRYFEENTDDVAMYILKGMVAERLGLLGSSCVPRREFVARCRGSGIKVASQFFSSERFAKEGFVLREDLIDRRV